LVEQRASPGYSITNYRGDRGSQGSEGEIFLDLEVPLPPDLEGRFDFVFNHTTLEHVFDFRHAFSNLCLMSRDAVILVLPWAQVAHPNPSFGDFWRFSPEAVRRLFEVEGFTPVYVSGSPMRNASVYVLGLGVRDPSRWIGRLPQAVLPAPLASWIGAPSVGHRLFAKIGMARRLNLTPTGFGPGKGMGHAARTANAFAAPPRRRANARRRSTNSR
jgi:hypothetical protein